MPKLKYMFSPIQTLLAVTESHRIGCWGCWTCLFKIALPPVGFTLPKELILNFIVIYNFGYILFKKKFFVKRLNNKLYLYSHKIRSYLAFYENNTHIFNELFTLS